MMSTDKPGTDVDTLLAVHAMLVMEKIGYSYVYLV